MTSLLKINIDHSNHSPATHTVFFMMMMVAGIDDGVAHLRQLRNQIVFGSQNTYLNKTQKKYEKVLHTYEYSISSAAQSAGFAVLSEANSEDVKFLN